MPGVETYLTFNGNCADAVRFYEKTLGAKIEMIFTHGESPMADKAPPEFKNQIMHCTLSIDNNKLMASDNMPGAPYNGMQGFTLSLSYPSTAEGEKIFNALAEGGKVNMPWQETFWVERWGSVTDKFGTPWMVNAGKSKM
ncbi:MAG TPA: VOC family protein [Gemmatimonadaceae bacterium]|nr:VOC family protein [Gemmatimonadaceae bacterium]